MSAVQDTDTLYWLILIDKSQIMSCCSNLVYSLKKIHKFDTLHLRIWHDTFNFTSRIWFYKYEVADLQSLSIKLSNNSWTCACRSVANTKMSLWKVHSKPYLLYNSSCCWGINNSSDKAFTFIIRTHRLARLARHLFAYIHPLLNI